MHQPQLNINLQDLLAIQSGPVARHVAWRLFSQIRDIARVVDPPVPAWPFREMDWQMSDEAHLDAQINATDRARIEVQAMADARLDSACHPGSPPGSQLLSWIRFSPDGGCLHRPDTSSEVEGRRRWCYERAFACAQGAPQGGAPRLWVNGVRQRDGRVPVVRSVAAEQILRGDMAQVVRS